MNKIISSIEWLEALSVNGMPLADIALLATWLTFLLLSLAVRSPLDRWKRCLAKWLAKGRAVVRSRLA